MLRRKNQQIKTKRSWGLILFGSLFAMPAMALFFWSIVPNIYESIKMQSWQTTQATLLSADVKHHSSSDSGTTFEAVASYQYVVNGTVYKNHRVQISSGNDNIGHFQTDLGSKLSSDFAYKRPIIIYYNRDNPAESIIHRKLRWKLLLFTSMFVALFGLAGFGIMYWGWRGKKSNISPETLSQPWLSEPSWMNNEINSDSKTSFQFALIFAIFWNLISTPIAFFGLADAYNKEGLIVALIVLAFPAVGLGLLFWSYSSWKQWKKYGRTPLILSPFPGNIGGDVGGKVLFTQKLSKEHDYKVTLTLVKTGSDNDERMIWQKEGQATLKQVYSHKAISELQFRFKVPDHLHESELLPKYRHIWRVTIANKAITLNRSFDIPVYKLKNQTATVLNNKNISSDNYNKKYSSVTDSPQSSKTGDRKIRIENYLPFQNKSTNSFVSLSEKTVIHYPLFRKLGLHAIFTAAGSLFFLIGVFLWYEKDAPVFMATFFGLIGGMTALAGFYGLAHSLTVTLGNNQLDVVKKILSFTISKHSVNYNEIQSINNKITHRSQSAGKHITHYKVFALLKNGKKIKIADAENITALNAVLDYFRKKLGLS
ncbi:MAG: DUF3592 domain-containing protein [Cocleimonas sp.]